MRWAKQPAAEPEAAVELAAMHAARKPTTDRLAESGNIDWVLAAATVAMCARMMWRLL